MRCPFGYTRRWTKFSFGVDPDFMDKVMAEDDQAERAFNAAHPTCWLKFLHWIGVR